MTQGHIELNQQRDKKKRTIYEKTNVLLVSLYSRYRCHDDNI